MKVAVIFEPVPDYSLLSSDDWVPEALSLNVDFVQHILTCFEETALELGLKLAEQAHRKQEPVELSALGLGSQRVDPFLKRLRALSYEGTTRLDLPRQMDLRFHPQQRARLVAAYVDQVGQHDLVLLGQQGGVGDCRQTGYFVAELLGWPCVREVSELQFVSANQVRVTSLLHSMRLEQTLTLPLVIIVGNSTSCPYLRVPTLQQKLRASAAPIKVLSCPDLRLPRAVSDSEPQLVNLRTIPVRGATEEIKGDGPRAKAQILYDKFLRIPRPRALTTLFPQTVRGQSRTALVLDANSPDLLAHLAETEQFLDQSGLGDRDQREVWVFYHGTRPQRLLRFLGSWSVKLISVEKPIVAESFLGLLEQLFRQSAKDVLCFPGDAWGEELATRLAYRLGGSSALRLTRAELAGSGLCIEREAYGNHLRAGFTLVASPWCLSVSRQAQQLLPPERNRAQWQDLHLPQIEPHWVVAQQTSALPSREDTPITAADFLLVVGRGVGSKEGLDQIARVASSLGAELAVSRPVAMNGWAGLERLVGASGAVVAPALCIVAGASGSGAFNVGIRNSERIVAINTDRRAPICDLADAVIIDDLHQVLSELTAIAHSDQKPMSAGGSRVGGRGAPGMSED